MAVCIFILLYINYEISYDKYHGDYKRIYRCSRIKTNSPDAKPLIFHQYNFAERVKGSIPDIESAARVEALPFYSKPIISYNNNTFYENGHISADPAFLQIFKYDAVYGNINTALNDPNSLVLTESLARKYFGNTNPVGKSVVFESPWEKLTKVITAVVKDVPANSHIQFRMLTPIVIRPGNEYNANYITYFKIRINSHIENITRKIYDLLTSESNSRYKNVKFMLQNVADIHLNPAPQYEIGTPGNSAGIYIFSTLAVIVLLLACINFMNITTAGSIRRTKEVGLRKVIGADKKDLIKQFIGESFMQSLISFILAVFAVAVSLPFFTKFADISVGIKELFSPFFIVELIGLVIITGWVAGAYPAFVLSRMNPAGIFKKDITNRKWNINITKIFVGLQFIITSVLIIGVIIILKQLDHVMNKDLGYNKEEIMVVNVKTGEDSKNELLKLKISNLPQIYSSCLTSFLPDNIARQSGFVAETGSGMSEMLMCTSGRIDKDFIKTYNVHLIQGNNISDLVVDTIAETKDQYILNETAVKTFNIQQPVGKLFGLGIKYKGVIVGVVKDFYFASQHELIKPLILHYFSDPVGYWSIKINTKDIKSAISLIENKFKEVYSDKPFDYFFFDEQFNNLYKVDIKFADIVGLFAGLSIFIACMGLFGQVLYSVELRKKEIGIRKTLGADIKNILFIISKDFINIIIISNVLAIPLAYILSQKWLDGFAYKTENEWWIYLVAMAVSIILSIATISFRVYKAAISNPVEVIRYE